MTVVLMPEQERVLREAINSGLAHTPDEALDQALQALKSRLREHEGEANQSVAEAVRRLATFGERYSLSLGGMTVRRSCARAGLEPPGGGRLDEAWAASL